jgi:hypothetical protein
VVDTSDDNHFFCIARKDTCLALGGSAISLLSYYICCILIKKRESLRMTNQMQLKCEAITMWIQNLCVAVVVLLLAVGGVPVLGNQGEVVPCVAHYYV